ncbi:MAG: HEPN domain-containing protein [Halochromatium sp.]
MADRTLAEILLLAAERDQQAFDTLAQDPNLHDSLAGFHAQQAVEKALKAVLAHAAVRFRRTHDIAELLDLLEDAGIGPPPHAAHLDELNPYAVEMRYGLVEPSGLDRSKTACWVRDVIQWSRARLQSE